MTEEQRLCLVKAQESIFKCRAFAIKAKALGLPVLASFLNESATVIGHGIELQERALRDNTLLEPAEERQAIQDESKQAQILADTMKRRGLV